MHSTRQYEAILRGHLPSYLKKVFYTVSPQAQYLHNWHIDLIAEYLQACEKGQISRLIINMPPRYLKSIAVNVGWTSWLLGHNPSERIISSSYANALSIKHSLDTRLVMNSEWYKNIFPETQLVDDQNTKSKFVTTKRGHRIATATGSMVTGEGGNFLIVDDPTNMVDANSETARQNAIDWFEQAFLTRLDNKKKGVVLVVMQRLHEGDLSGHLLAKGGWEHLKIPVEASQKTVFVYPISGKCKYMEAGELLHEDRENKKTLENTKKDLGSFGFAGQYLQEPAAKGGGMLKKENIKYFEKEAEFVSTYISLDTAIKDGQENDYTVATVWGVTDIEDLHLRNLVRKKLQFPNLVSMITELSSIYQPDAVIIEDKASGSSLLQQLKKETNINIIGYDPKGEDKISRFARATISFEAEKVYFYKSDAWLEDLEHELLTFPKGKHDDQVDSISQFINWFRAKGTLSPRIRRL